MEGKVVICTFFAGNLPGSEAIASPTWRPSNRKGFKTIPDPEPFKLAFTKKIN
jgi:hypothetical protein